VPLTMQEEIRFRAAFMEIKRERRESLRQMFQGTRLVPKSLLDDAKTMATDAKAAVTAVGKVPGVQAPNLALLKVDVPSLNLRLFNGIDLRRLIDINIPSLSLPGWDLNLIPDIHLGSFPGFDLPRVRLNLKGLLKYKDLFPDISLRALVWAIGIKFPHLSLPSIAFDLKNILGLDWDLELVFPDFMRIDLSVDMPNFALPDVSLPTIGLPPFDVSVPHINLGDIHIPDFDIGPFLRIPGFPKVMALLFELFDTVDIPDIMAELGVQFLTDFISSALPVVQQVKSGAQAAYSWGKAAQQLHKSCKVSKHMPFILPGNARDACEAVRALLRESSGEFAATATIQTAQFATSTAGLFADLGGVTGPAVSAAAAVAKMCQSITIFAIKYKEMKKINHVLGTTPAEALTSNIFAVSPLLGCYYLANNTTSNCLNILCDNLLEDDWMADAARNKTRHLDPLIQDAQSFINKSRYVLTPIRQNKGMFVEKSTSEKLKERIALYLKKKVGLAPASARVSTHRRIG